MIRSLFFFLLFLNIFFNVVAQNKYNVELMPSHLKERAYATVREERIDVEMKSSTQVNCRLFRVITIHNKSGEEYADIELHYNKSRQIKSISGEIYNEFGIVIGKFSAKEFKDRSASGQSNLYDDIRVKTYSPAVYTYPYTIAYTVEFRENQNLSIPIWTPNYDYNVSVEQSSYSFTCSPAEKIRIQQENHPDSPQIEENTKFKTYTWRAQDIEAQRYEPYSPPRHLAAILVRIVPENFQYYKKKGSFTNWNELGKWVYDDLLADKRKLPASTVADVKSMTEHLENPKEKTKALYHYLQEKTRYISIQVGIGGLEPFPAESVVQLGYGDCKALVNYMQSMLDVIGIPSYYCVVNAGTNKRDISKDFANVSDGNHIILCIPFENDTTWLECTSQRLPFGFLGDFTDDRLVLACSPEGGKLLRTPKLSSEDNLQYREAKFEVGKDGSLEGNITTVFKGTQMDNHLYNAFLPLQEQTLNLKRWYDVDQIQFKQIAYDIASDTILAVSELLDIHIRNYVVTSGDYAVIHPNIFNSSSTIPASRNRINPVYINRGFTDIDITTYKLPETIEPKILPLEKNLTTSIGSYEFRTSIADGILTCYRKFQLNEGTYPAETYADFHKFLIEVNASDRGKYNLSIKK